MGEDKSKCTECCKETTRLYDGLCIECAYKELMIKTKGAVPYMPTYPTLPIPPSYPAQNGWICPKCGRTYNSSQTNCPYCGSNYYQPLNIVWCGTTITTTFNSGG